MQEIKRNFNLRRHKMEADDFKRIQDKSRALWIEKDKLYGEHNVEIFGLDGLIIRISDKVQRLINMAYHKDIKDYEESVCDTLIDLSNYAIMAVLLIEKEWEKKN